MSAPTKQRWMWCSRQSSTLAKIMSAQADIDVHISEIKIAGPVILPHPVEGDAFYASATKTVQMPSLNIFIGGDIAGVNGTSGEDTLGLASGIPGPANFF